MFGSNRVLDVRSTGPRSVVGLKTDRINDEAVVVRLFDEIDQYLRGGPCDVLVIDIEGIQSLPSGFIGHLVNLRRQVRVELVNVSEYVQLVLETSQLTKLFTPASDATKSGDSHEE